MPESNLMHFYLVRRGQGTTYKIRLYLRIEHVQNDQRNKMLTSYVLWHITVFFQSFPWWEIKCYILKLLGPG